MTTRHAVAVGLLLALATTAAANMPPPMNKFQWHFVVFEVPDDSAEWTYFVQDEGLRRMELDADRTFEVRADSLWHGSPGQLIVIWAIRTDEVSRAADKGKYQFELDVLAREGKAVRSDSIKLNHWAASVADVSDGIEYRYRLERTPTELRLHKLGERTRYSVGMIVVWAAVVSAVLAFFGWLAVKWRAGSRRVTRTTLPPGR